MKLLRGCQWAALAGLVFSPCGASAASVLASFAGIGQTSFVPSDMGGAVGTNNSVVQIVNGGFRITDTTGAVVQTQISDSQFWLNAGISAADVSKGVSDPRVIFDPGTQRYFVSEINVDQTANVGNKIFLAVSNTSDPTQGFRGVSIPALQNFTGSAPLADFPTIGVDQKSIYIGTNNFANDNTFSNVSLLAIPKAAFVAGQSISGLSRFDGINANTYGFTLQPITSTSATAAILAIDNQTFGTVDLTSVLGAGAAGATLGSTNYITGLADGIPAPQRQPGVSTTLDGSDDRILGIVYQVGDFIYAANTIGDSQLSSTQSTHDSVHWMILNALTHALVADGLITDVNYDFTYPSIAANQNGDFVIGYNRAGSSAPDGYLSDYASVCHFDLASNVSCESPLLIASGNVSYTQGYQRWGDYSAAQVDPNNPNNFWLFQSLPATSGTWGTQITEIGLTTPEPGTFGLLGVAGLLAAIRKRKRIV